MWVRLSSCSAWCLKRGRDIRRTIRKENEVGSFPVVCRLDHHDRKVTGGVGVEGSRLDGCQQAQSGWYREVIRTSITRGWVITKAPNVWVVGTLPGSEVAARRVVLGPRGGGGQSVNQRPCNQAADEYEG
eukprot:752356-Hanusia_phi.AAC.2